jgi:hypothetical protein
MCVDVCWHAVLYLFLSGMDDSKIFIYWNMCNLVSRTHKMFDDDQ